MLELAPFFVSIVGAPACGKTYFLASMVWRLRHELPQRYCLSFVDADPKSNRVLNEYEEQQFFNNNRNELVKLAKTEEHGHLYNTVNFAGREVTYPMPFLFAVRPTPQHPSHNRSDRVAKLLCLYDNAGESFQPGKDSGRNQVTRHLSKSDALMFLYDPTQEPRFREACAGYSRDPQVTNATVTSRQEVVFHELTDRVRKLTGLKQNQQHDRPVFIVVTKADTWSRLLDSPLPRCPAVSNQRGDWWALDMDVLLDVSRRTRSLLAKYSQELVSAAESFAREVHYIPVSALGMSPERDEETGRLGVRPGYVEPTWVEIPLLWMLSKSCPGLVPYKRVSQV